MKTFNEAAHKIATEIAELIISKQHDYGHGNILAFGEFGVLVRASDKLERLKNLSKKGALKVPIFEECPHCGEIMATGEMKPLHEATEDTWMDLAGYSLIALMLRRGIFTLPLEGAK